MVYNSLRMELRWHSMGPLEPSLQCPPRNTRPEGFGHLYSRSRGYGRVSNALPMSPRYLHKFSHYHMPAPAEGPCHPHHRPIPQSRGDSLPRRSSFSRSRDVGFTSQLILDFDRGGERFPANGGFKLYIQFLVVMVCYLYILVGESTADDSDTVVVRNAGSRNSASYISQTTFREMDHRRPTESHTS